jgi:hypothetical protein
MSEHSTIGIGWDVGGWNCDKDSKSRDALVIVGARGELLGQPWRGNLRHVINEAVNSGVHSVTWWNVAMRRSAPRCLP